MNNLPEILLSNLFLIIVWAFFELCLRNKRNFNANRFFLLAGTILAAILPWLPWQIRIPVPIEAFPVIPAAPTGETLAFDPIPAVQSVALPAGTPVNWLAVIYFSVVGILVATFLAQTVRMLLWTRRRPVTRWDRYRVVEMNKSWPAFSFFSTIYYPEPFEPDKRETITILEHERVHARQLHSIDNLLLLVIRILFFYNPAVHLLAGRLRLTHEFLADAATAGANKAEYSQTLIRHQFLVPRLLLMHSFNNKSFLSRRLNMLMKNNTHSRAGWIYLLAVPLLAGMFLLSGWSASAQDPQKGQKDEMKARIEKDLNMNGFTKTSDSTWVRDGTTITLTENEDLATIKARLKQAEENKEALMAAKKQGEDLVLKEYQDKPQDVDKKVKACDEMPVFQGSQTTGFPTWVQAQLKFPDEALKKGLTGGTVYISFVVNKLGKVEDVKVKRGVDPVLDEVVLKVVRNSPDWTPGKYKGKTVDVPFMIPIKFDLATEDAKTGTASHLPAVGKVFLIVEEMPTFQGGKIEDFRNWVQSNVKYPELAKQKSISGTEYVAFIVDTTGRVVDPKIIRSADPILDAEIMRVLCSAPLWKPGEQRGQLVNVSFSIPVKFILDGQAGDQLPKDSLGGKNLKGAAQPKPSLVNGVAFTGDVISRDGNTVYVDGKRVEEPGAKVFLIVEEMPTFQGGKIDDFRNWVQGHLEYPAMAVENKIQGTVYVSFVVNSKGKVVTPNIDRKVDPILDEEVLRLLKSAPDWKPGNQRGEPVNVFFSIPVKFELANTNLEITDDPEGPVFTVCEEMPEFQGGSLAEFQGWAQAMVKYPPKAMEESKSGTVEVSFIVNKKGEVEDVTIEKSAGPILDEAVMNVIKSSPVWKPGKQRGKLVKVSQTIPVKFILN